MRLLITTFATLGAFALPAMGQDATTIQTGESEKFGEYLVTGEDRPVYLFTTDTQGTADAEAEITCTSEDCLGVWPLVTTQGDPQAGGNADADMLGTTQYEGETVVTYNGRPLYLFAKDEGADMPQGQEIESFGGEWYLVTPDGEELHAE